MKIKTDSSTTGVHVQLLFHGRPILLYLLDTLVMSWPILIVFLTFVVHVSLNNDWRKSCSKVKREKEEKKPFEAPAFPSHHSTHGENQRNWDGRKDRQISENCSTHFRSNDHDSSCYKTSSRVYMKDFGDFSGIWKS